MITISKEYTIEASVSATVYVTGMDEVYDDGLRGIICRAYTTGSSFVYLTAMSVYRDDDYGYHWRLTLRNIHTSSVTATCYLYILCINSNRLLSY